MPLTVADLVRDLGLRLAAGHAGAQAPVRWVHISNLADPTPWLTGGELLLTTGIGGADPGEYVERLVAHGLAGLGLGTGFEHDTVPDALRVAADRHGFPLLEVPYEVPFIAVTEHAGTRLVNEQYAVLRRALQAHERLEGVLLAEGGVQGLADALAALLGPDGGACIVGARGEHLASSGLDDAAIATLGDDVAARAAAGGRRDFVPSEDLAGRALVLPVRRAPEAADAPPAAWLAGVAADTLSELDRLVLRQATTVVALELMRRRVADDTTRRLAGDVLSALVSGELAGPELVRRLEPFGLRGRVGALVALSDRPGREHVEDALTTALRDEALVGLVAGAGRFACVLLPGGDELFATAERIRARAEAVLGRPLPAGAGRPQPPGQARRAFHEARCALEARAMTDASRAGHPGLATYEDLGSFQLLLSLQDDEALRLFCDSLLAPIESGEGTYGGELMKSLAVFIDCNGQWERAAKQLFVHRHTLRYRIRKVEELTGRSLDSARDRIEFWLALQARELIA